MFITGISDEAGKDLDTQIRAHKELGWDRMEIRDVSVDGGKADNLHDISEEDFENTVERIQNAGLEVYCFSSRIANWGKKIDEPFDSSLEEIERCIPRMKRLGTKYVRVMSFKVRFGEEDQMEEERFKRLREIVKRFSDEGLTPLHENCMNYGGMGYTYTLKMLENVPGLRLVFDTGNPFFADDHTKSEPHPKQSAWEFYDHVREFVDYVHIKDGHWVGKKTFCWPGEGEGDVERIIQDLVANGYQGGLSIEPHMGAVYDLPGAASDAEKQYAMYLEYGRRMEALVDRVRSAASV